MKNTTRLWLALFASLFFAVGFARAADKADTITQGTFSFQADSGMTSSGDTTRGGGNDGQP